MVSDKIYMCHVCRRLFVHQKETNAGWLLTLPHCSSTCQATTSFGLGQHLAGQRYLDMHIKFVDAPTIFLVHPDFVASGAV